MDFSILNILVRTPSLPASDPWFAGAPLGYYTFGQEMVVFLTLLTGLSTRYTFNLAFGFLGGAILQGAFSLGRNWGRRLRAGVAGGRAHRSSSATSRGCGSGSSQQARARLGLLLGHVARHQGHDQRVSVLEPDVRGPARARARDPDLPDVHGGGAPPGSPPRRPPAASLRARVGGAVFLGFVGGRAGADERLGRAPAGRASSS